MAIIKKIIVILLIIVVAVSLASLLGFTKVKLPFLKPKAVTLTYWGLWEEENVIKPLIDDYQKNHPNVTINYIKQSKIQYRERLQNVIDKGEGPDLFRFHNTWLPMFKNSLSPLPKSVMTVQEFQNTFYPVAYDNLFSNGNIYGLPLEVDTLALFYNEDLFQKGGATVPTTWNELRAVANSLTVKDADGRIKISGIALGTAGNIEHFSDILGLMFMQNGTDLRKISSTFSKDGHNLGEDTLKYYTNFTLLDHVWDETMDNSIVAFAGGKVAMIIAPSWEIFEIKNLNSTLPFKIVPVPQIPEKNLNWATYWVEGVSAKSKNQEAAWDFLNYLVTKENLIKMYTLCANSRLFGEPYSRLDLAATLKSDVLVSPFITQTSNAASWYLASRTYDNGINDQNIKYLEDAVNNVIRGGDVLKSLQTVEQGFSQVLDRYQTSQ